MTEWWENENFARCVLLKLKTTVHKDMFCLKKKYAMEEYGSRHKCCIIVYIQGILASIHTHMHSVCVYADMCISSEDTSQLCLSKWCLLWKWTICFTALLFLRSAVWQFSTCNVTSSPPPPDELQYVTGSSHQLYVVSVSRNPISVQSESAAVLELDLSLRLTERVIWCQKKPQEGICHLTLEWTAAL